MIEIIGSPIKGLRILTVLKSQNRHKIRLKINKQKGNENFASNHQQAQALQ